MGHSIQNDLKVSCEHMRYSNAFDQCTMLYPKLPFHDRCCCYHTQTEALETRPSIDHSRELSRWGPSVCVGGHTHSLSSPMLLQSKTPSLKRLAKQLLGLEIQTGEHDSVRLHPVYVLSCIIKLIRACYCVYGKQWAWMYIGVL